MSWSPTPSTTTGPTSPEPQFWTSLEPGEPEPNPWTADTADLVTRAAADPTPGLHVQPDAGPDSGYTAKRQVGFTGLRCLHYSGRHTDDGRGYACTGLFEVHIPVVAGSQLSYTIMPADPSDGTALPAAGSFVAIDLAFSDGSRLRDLEATDQYGFALTASGQGSARVLYANQWNSVRSEIGAVAEGRTITQIMITYQRTGDARDISGWIDDISISAAPADTAPRRLSDWVDTRRGTNSNGAFSRGGVIPAVAVPHGFNFWTPVTDAGSRKWLYHYQQQNNADNLPTLQALSLSHLAYPWGTDHGTFQLMPCTDTGVPNPDHVERALPFRHADEVARAHHYRVRFCNGLIAEIAPTDHAAILRFVFPGDDANLIFDNIDGHSRGLALDPDHHRLTATSGDGSDRMYIVAQFDRPVIAGGSLQGERGGMGYFRFDVGADRTVIMRIATSRISAEQAEHNLDLEIAPEDTFDSVRERAQQQWDVTLGVITDITGASPEQLITFYSCLYRMSLYQNAMHENVGTAEQPEIRHAVRTGDELEIRTGTRFNSTVFWDTYRTTFPALSLLYPAQTAALLDGIVASYRASGWLGVGMVGTSSDVVLADAYLRGVTDFDVHGGYESAIKNATVASSDPRLGRPDQQRSIFLGYTPMSEEVARSGGTDEGTAESLENYLNDFGIANLAAALHARTGEQRYLDESRYFANRALGYVHLFDPAIGFFQGRTADGSRRLPADRYDPKVWGYDYTETNGWGMAFAAPHDGRGLANLYGGREGLADKLDEFFATPERMDDFGSYGGIIHEQREAASVQIGQWGLSNQPAFHIAHLYNAAGRPDLAQERIREALARLFVGGDIGQGYPGDEDTGSMSAWYVLNALGLYPLRVGSPTFVLGSPLFRTATINLQNGKSITVEAPQNSPRNIYLQGLRINSEPYHRTEVAQSMLTDGATLQFDLGPTPSDWGTSPDAAPESITPDDRIPTPMLDLTGTHAGVASSTIGESATAPDPGALFDDTSDTEVIFPGPAAAVTWEFTGPARIVGLYTLTSAAGDGGDPADWELQGSDDGRQWQTLDRRTGESFSWRRQTRPFSISDPAGNRHYRLLVQATCDGRPLALAEIELLGWE